MTTLREAAQQALEFLDAEFGWSPGEAPRIDALRAALAQQQTKRACCTYPDCRCPIDKSTVCAKGLPEQAEPQPTPIMAEITRLRAERDALADRLREVRAQLNDTIDAHRQKKVMNAWAEQRLARHGIPMPEGDPK